MRRISWSAGTVAAVASALAGCQAKLPPPVDTDTGVAGAPRFAPISAICPTLPKMLPVVKISITDVAPKKLGHVTAQFESDQYGTASTGEKVKDIAEVVLKTDNPTRLDLDAREYLKKAGDVILVEVELADAAASFVPGPAALTVGNPDGAAMFCVRDKDSAINPKPGDRTVRFYVGSTWRNRT